MKNKILPNSSIIKPLKYFMGFIFLIITSCHFNSSYTNREVDRQEGEKTVAEFYELMKDRNHKATYILFDNRFFEITDTHKLNDIYKTSLEKLGEIERYDIEQWATEAIMGTDSRTNYVFICNVKRSNYNSQETITLMKEKDSIKIVGYHINSDAFLLN